MNKNSKIQISIIIAAYNEEKYLPHCLESIKKQNFMGITEVIVVDNNSTDKTAQIAQKWGAKVVPEKTQGIAPAKARGAKEAKGEIIAFIDADITCRPDWLSQIWKNFEKNPKLVALGGPYILENLSPWKQKISKIIHLSLLKILKMVPGGCMAFKKTAFEKVGGFSHEISFGEDIDISLKIVNAGKVSAKEKLAVFESGRRSRQGFMSFWVDYLRYVLPAVLFNQKFRLKKARLKPIR